MSLPTKPSQPLAGRRTSQACDNTLSSSPSPLYITLGCRESFSRQAAPWQARLSLTCSFTSLSLLDLLKVGRKPKTVTWITTIYMFNL